MLSFWVKILILKNRHNVIAVNLFVITKVNSKYDIDIKEIFSKRDKLS